MSFSPSSHPISALTFFPHPTSFLWLTNLSLLSAHRTSFSLPTDCLLFFLPTDLLLLPHPSTFSAPSPINLLLFSHPPTFFHSLTLQLSSTPSPTKPSSTSPPTNILLYPRPPIFFSTPSPTNLLLLPRVPTFFYPLTHHQPSYTPSHTNPLLLFHYQPSSSSCLTDLLVLSRPPTLLTRSQQTLFIFSTQLTGLSPNRPGSQHFFLRPPTFFHTSAHRPLFYSSNQLFLILCPTKPPLRKLTRLTALPTRIWRSISTTNKGPSPRLIIFHILFGFILFLSRLSPRSWESRCFCGRSSLLVGQETAIKMSLRPVSLAAFFPAEAEIREDSQTSGAEKGTCYFLLCEFLYKVVRVALQCFV